VQIPAAVDAAVGVVADVLVVVVGVVVVVVVVVVVADVVVVVAGVVVVVVEVGVGVLCLLPPEAPGPTTEVGELRVTDAWAALPRSATAPVPDAASTAAVAPIRTVPRPVRRPPAEAPALCRPARLASRAVIDRSPRCRPAHPGRFEESVFAGFPRRRQRVTAALRQV
jgi:hypothetical protein